VEPVADVEGIAAEVAEESAGSSESGFERNGTRERRGRNTGESPCRVVRHRISSQ
jgi:hypothetical protein